MPLITVITPTYNRADELCRLYKSLVNQNCDFKWLIVDDGSVDNTQELAEIFIKEASFPIQYLKKKNGGKHTALNYGIRHIDTELTIIVDSDDTLTSGAIKTIEKDYEKYKDNAIIGCLTYLRCFSNGKPIVPLEQTEFIANYIEYRIKGDRPGDMAEVYKTEILKSYPFPEFEGEKFISEDVVWIEIGKRYDTVYINKAIYECEYLEGGLTFNDKPMKFSSPFGSMLRGKQLLTKECGIKANIKGAIIYNCYKLEATSKIPMSLQLKGLSKVLVWLLYPMGKIYNRKWRKL